jgi:hypothetical protein
MNGVTIGGFGHREGPHHGLLVTDLGEEILERTPVDLPLSAAGA